MLSSSELNFIEPSHIFGKEEERRFVLGIIIGKYLVQSSICDNNDKDDLFQWILRIMLSQL